MEPSSVNVVGAQLRLRRVAGHVACAAAAKKKQQQLKAATSPPAAPPAMSANDRAAHQRDVDMSSELLPAGVAPPASTPLLPVAIHSHLAIPMRDGIKLYADLYLPAAAPVGRRYPTVVNRTPYNHEHMKTKNHIGFAQAGFAFLEVYVRGKVESEGVWEPFRNDGQDGFDVIEWAAAQPWSTGRVACQGGSYPGQNQWMTAVLQPPSLVCIKPNVASTSLYHNWCYSQGCFRLAFNFGWGVVRMPHRVMKAQVWHQEGPPELHYDQILRHRPLETADVAAANTVVQYYRDWLAHPEDDDYWRHVSVEHRFASIRTPAFTEGGWFDIFLAGTLNGYVGTKSLGSRLCVGPWGHMPSASFGDLSFGPLAMRDRDAADVAWFRHHLCNEPLSLPASHPVEIFYMGANVWQYERDWPIPGTKFERWSLGSDGTLLSPSHVKNTSESGGSSSFDYDADNPCPTLGGNNCCGAPTIAGPKNQQPLTDSRSDILSFTSSLLAQPVAIAGPLTAQLHAHTTAGGRGAMDWMVKLIDVHPSGEAYAMAEGIVRSHDTSTIVTVDLTGTALVFLEGHQIRLDITSASFPQFAACENSATNTIYFDDSFVTLPVVGMPTGGLA
jgi:putative CocE/NonD family hydrolase